MLSRNTYMEIYPNNIENNIKKIIQNHNNYEYYFGVIKADSYGLGVQNTIDAVINGGCNYLAVATYEEAIEIRNKNKEISILCLGIIPKEYLNECIKNNITITVNSLNYLNELEELVNEECKVHIKLNTGMNRLGIKDKEELKKVFEILQNRKVNVEGIYSHIYDAGNEERYKEQIKIYEELIDQIDISKIKIKHISASDALANYKKPDFINGCRLRNNNVWIYKLQRIKFRINL